MLFDILLSRHREPETPVMLYNTMSRSKERFAPRSRSEVTLYSCGPTVYDHVHIGNLRSYLLADLLKRTLIANGYRNVKHTMNFTDFGHLQGDGDAGDDKMMGALKREGKPFTLDAMREVGARYAESAKADMAALNMLPPTYTPASDYIREAVALVKTLYEKGYAYETSDGVYFDISKFSEYGALGNVDVSKLESGARIEVNPEKKHPADFAIWKKSPLGWNSQWGSGFPGWHIECTAMIFATLGKQIDLHTGGIDLAPTHHNAEIAQAEAATKKKPFVRYWLHNAHIGIDNTKISKSLGNGIRLTQLRERGYPPLAYRYWVLSGHYRSPMNFTFEALDGAKQALYRLKRHIYEEYKAEKGGAVLPEYRERFFAALNDDLDSPAALAAAWKLVDDKSASAKDKVATLAEFDKVLGLGLDEPREEAIRTLGVVPVEELPDDVQTLIEEREAARAAKDWQKADELREALNLAGYLVEDKPDGPRVTKA